MPTSQWQSTNLNVKKREEKERQGNKTRKNKANKTKTQKTKLKKDKEKMNNQIIKRDEKYLWTTTLLKSDQIWHNRTDGT